MAEEKKVQWGVPSQLENITANLRVSISYLDFNKAKVQEKFGNRTEEIFNVLNEVKSWMTEESEIMHKQIASVLENSIGDNMDISKLLVNKATDNFRNSIEHIIDYIETSQNQGPMNDGEILEAVKHRLIGISEAIAMTQENDRMIDAANNAPKVD